MSDGNMNIREGVKSARNGKYTIFPSFKISLKDDSLFKTRIEVYCWVYNM